MVLGVVHRWDAGLYASAKKTRESCKNDSCIYVYMNKGMNVYKDRRSRSAEWREVFWTLDLVLIAERDRLTHRVMDY